MKHGIAKEAICSCLITWARGFEPFNDIRIQTQRHRLFGRTIELPHFGSGPVENQWNIGKINLFVFLGGDGANVA